MVRFLGSGISNHFCWAHQFLQHPCNDLWICQMCRYSYSSQYIMIQIQDFFFKVLEANHWATELLRHICKLYSWDSLLFFLVFLISLLTCLFWPVTLCFSANWYLYDFILLIRHSYLSLLTFLASDIYIIEILFLISNLLSI